MPIIVSRVAPNTPADVCIPRLNEGDQVLYINGRDVSQHTHEQVRIHGNTPNTQEQGYIHGHSNTITLVTFAEYRVPWK